MILIKLNNDRNNLNTFIDDIETKVFYILYICFTTHTSFYINSRIYKTFDKIQNSL